MYAPRKATVLCSRIVFWAGLLLDVGTQTVFLYCMSVTYTLKRYFWCFWCPRYALVVMSNRRNQYNFLTLHRFYMGAQVNSSAIANIHWLMQTFKYQSFGFKVHCKSILVYNLKTKSGLWSKCLHYIKGFIFFLFSFVLNLVCIGYSLCQIWSVYMQYLRWCDHSNKCLLLVIQQAEVLLNFFGGCISILRGRVGISVKSYFRDVIFSLCCNFKELDIIAWDAWDWCLITLDSGYVA